MGDHSIIIIFLFYIFFLIDSELSFSDTKLMFQDILEKLATSKNISSRMFWEKYRFHPYNSKNCKIAFEKILSKVSWIFKNQSRL